jgi:TolB-like protein/AraC-like DNA-binding protein/tetratricopeptide (TPR) repeat protein
MHSNFIQKLTNIVEANLENESFGPDDLAKEAGMSHSNLNRKLKTISNQNASQFIREIRLKKAKELLQNEDLTVAEISYRIGFGSPTYFNTCFHAYFGVSPGELRNHDRENEPETYPVTPNRKKSKRTYILISLLFGLLVLIPILYFIIHTITSSKEIPKEKSIAVLPFKYLSNEADKQYLADGMMDAILVDLSKIKNLHVISRTSVEQYRKTAKTSKEIGRELDVEYILECSFLMKGNQGRLILQLIRTSDDSHIWSEIFDHDWKDVFSVQSEVAETVASKMQAVITPQEQQIIRKTPTSNLTAYDYYIKGKSELEKYEFTSKGGLTELNNARHLFQKALDLDSTFSLAYTGMATVQHYSISVEASLSENCMDSVSMYADKALRYDNQCAEAYYYRAQVYSMSSKNAEALKELDKALAYNPNDWRSYSLRSSIFEIIQDYVGAISNSYEVVLRNRGDGLPLFLTTLSYKLANPGFADLGKKYIQQALELNGDSVSYIRYLAWLEYCNQDYETAYQIAKTLYKKDTTEPYDLDLYCVVTGRHKEAYALEIKSFEQMRKSGDFLMNYQRGLAYYYWKEGKIKEAKFYINNLIKFYQECINLRRPGAIMKANQFDLAEMYALIGDKEKAYYYLDEVNKNKAFPMWWVILFKYEPLFDNIRQEPRFQKILKDVEAKYQAEHIRVGKWLKEKGLL